MNKTDQTWAGTLSAWNEYSAAQEGMQKRLAAGDWPDDDDDDEDEALRLLQVQDGVAVISIHGGLTNSDSWMNQYFGLVSYGEIREALIAATKDEGVSQILLSVESGGGAVAGVEDTANLIRMINDKVKPVTAFIDGVGASAAYWLSSAAGDIYAGKTSVVGSIGVLSVHTEYTKRNEMEGVTKTVIRAGSEKALANTNEVLSEKGKAQVQQVVDAVYNVFVSHVATMRGKSFDYADQVMAQGKEFVGAMAADVGLVDGITSFDALMTDLKAKSIDPSNKFMDNRNKQNLRMVGEAAPAISAGQSSTSNAQAASPGTNQGETDMGKKALTEQDIAALAAGAVVADVSGVSVEASAQAVVEEGAAAPHGEAQAVAATDQKASEGDGVAAPVEAANSDKTASSDQLAPMMTLLREKDADLIKAHVEIANLKASVESLNAAVTPLMQIAGKSVSNMRIALGGAAFVAEGLNPAQVLAEHDSVSAQFQTKFKAGGVAAVSATVADAEKKTQIDPRHLARVNAARFQK